MVSGNTRHRKNGPYAEKYIILEDETEQEIPFHYHMDKTEDIINRGGGVMIVARCYNDDTCDNVFRVDSARSCPVEEDEPILHPLVNEYDAVL